MRHNLVTETNRQSSIGLYIIAGFSIFLFSPKLFNKSLLEGATYLVIAFAIFISIRHMFVRTSFVGKIIRIIFFFQLLSIFMAYFTWDQSLDDGLKATLLFMLWPLYFYLAYHKVPIKALEHISMFYGVLYIILFAYQYKHSDVVIFGRVDEFNEERGVTRVVMPGLGFLFLAAFISINKLTSNCKYKLLYGLFSFSALLITILQVTRQNIAIMTVLFVYHLIRNVTVLYKIIICTVGLSILIYLANSDLAIVKGLAEAQKNTNEQGTNYIRILSGVYYLRDFSPNLGSRIFGNGAAFERLSEGTVYGNNNRYGKIVNSIEKDNGYYMSDVGIIGFYAMFGIFAALSYFILLTRLLLSRVANDYVYLKYYVVYLMLTCLTSDYIYSYNCLICNIFVFYSLNKFITIEKFKLVPNRDMPSNKVSNAILTSHARENLQTLSNRFS